MAPVVKELSRRERFRVITCVTAQHREMLDQVIETFGIPVDYDLDVMRQSQSLTHVTTSVLQGLEPLLETEQPHMVLVHGDTTTTFAAAVAAFYRQIPVAHIEAGLRTEQHLQPLSEEANRRLTDRLAEILLAPTEAARLALLAEGSAAQNIIVTGNTVIDALLQTADTPQPDYEPQVLGRSVEARPQGTGHGPPQGELGHAHAVHRRAIAASCRRHEDLTFIFPIHLNPVVRQPSAPYWATSPGWSSWSPSPTAPSCT